MMRVGSDHEVLHSIWKTSWSVDESTQVCRKWSWTKLFILSALPKFFLSWLQKFYMTLLDIEYQTDVMDISYFPGIVVGIQIKIFIYKFWYRQIYNSCLFISMYRNGRNFFWLHISCSESLYRELRPSNSVCFFPHNLIIGYFSPLLYLRKAPGTKLFVL